MQEFYVDIIIALQFLSLFVVNVTVTATTLAMETVK